MARYVIYDTESKTTVEMKGGRTGTMHGRFLSPEETEAKWKEVFDIGNREGWDEPFPATTHEQKWNELKKTL